MKKQRFPISLPSRIKQAEKSKDCFYVYRRQFFSVKLKRSVTPLFVDAVTGRRERDLM